MMRSFASPLLRSLTVAVYGSRRVRSRHHETEFPMATSRNGGSNLPESTFRGQRAADRVPNFGTLRPLHHWVNIEDQYELSFIRETLAPVARRISISARWPRSPAGTAGKGAQENVLAADSRLFWKRQRFKETGASGTQWRSRTCFATSAQT